MKASYRWALDDSLRKYGLEVPFPQLDLRMRSYFGHEGQAGMEAVAGETKRQTVVRNIETPDASVNAAAEGMAKGKPL